MVTVTYQSIHRRSLPVAILVGFLLTAARGNGADLDSPHSDDRQPVEVSVELVDPLEMHQPRLSEMVVVEATSVPCAECGESEPTGEHELDAWEGSQAECHWPDHSVRDELARRREARMGLCDGAAPRYRMRAGAVWMQRVKDDWRVLMESTANPLRQLNAEGFDFDWEPGLDLSLSRIGWDDHQCEFRFLGLQEFQSTQRIDTQGTEVRINSTPPVFVAGVNSIDAAHSSDLYGFELNWHYVTYRPFNYIFGFRYLGLDEEMSARLEAPPQVAGLRINTQNRLYGMQLGIESVPELPLFDWHCLTWFAKAGIFGNDADQRTVLATNLLGQVVSESPDTSSLVWEFGVGLDLPVTDCVSIQGGYSALIVDRIALVTDQLKTIDFLQATGSDNRGTVMFHGASLFLVWER